MKAYSYDSMNIKKVIGNSVNFIPTILKTEMTCTDSLKNTIYQINTC